MEFSPFWITLKTATAATFISFFLGIALAYAVLHMRRFQGIADAVITLPMVLPPTVVVSLPLMYRTARGAFEQLDKNIVYAARTLGISEWRIFWRILVPNAKHGIVAGLVLTFTRALGEFGATIMFAGNVPGTTQTMSTAIYAAVQANDYDLAFQWAAALVLFSLVFVAAMNAWLARSRG